MNESPKAVTPPKPASIVLRAFSLFFVAIFPVIAFLELLFSDWLFDRYGLYVAFFFFPIMCVVSALLLAAISFRYVFRSGTITLRVGSSLLFGILTVALSVGVFLVVHNIFPRKGRWL